MKSYGKKALRRAVNRQLAEFSTEYLIGVNAMVMWTLHETFGFGAKRLRRFWDGVTEVNRELNRRYRMNEAGDEEWLYVRKLRDIGVDIAAWRRENEERYPNGIDCEK